jgi:hypothetical protein
LGIYPDLNGFYLLYKRVNKRSKTNFESEYDRTFVYTLGQRTEVKDFNPDKTSGCGAGLHVSHPNYWIGGDTLVQVAVHESDIISWMQGKIRCKALTVVRVIEEG